MAKVIMVQGTMSNAGKEPDRGRTLQDFQTGRIPGGTF